MSLALIVLKATDLEKTKQFYQALGLTLVEEKHGNRPKHYSITLGDIVLEIYPDKNIERKVTQDNNIVLSFNVSSIDEVLNFLDQIAVKPASEIKQSSWGRHVSVLDPDNRTTELIETNKSCRNK